MGPNEKKLTEAVAGNDYEYQVKHRLRSALEDIRVALQQAAQDCGLVGKTGDAARAKFLELEEQTQRVAESVTALNAPLDDANAARSQAKRALAALDDEEPPSFWNDVTAGAKGFLTNPGSALPVVGGVVGGVSAADAIEQAQQDYRARREQHAKTAYETYANELKTTAITLPETIDPQRYNPTATSSGSDHSAGGGGGGTGRTTGAGYGGATSSGSRVEMSHEGSAPSAQASLGAAGANSEPSSDSPSLHDAPFSDRTSAGADEESTGWETGSDNLPDSLLLPDGPVGDGSTRFGDGGTSSGTGTGGGLLGSSSAGAGIGAGVGSAAVLGAGAVRSGAVGSAGRRGAGSPGTTSTPDSSSTGSSTRGLGMRAGLPDTRTPQSGSAQSGSPQSGSARSGVGQSTAGERSAASGAAESARPTPATGGVGGQGSGRAEQRRSRGLGGPIAPKLDDEPEPEARSAAYGPGSRPPKPTQ